MGTNCWSCGTEIPENNLGRQDSCGKCGKDTRSCRNCTHYDRTRNNECREEQAGRQVEKEKGNFCEWFQARQGGAQQLFDVLLHGAGKSNCRICG